MNTFTTSKTLPALVLAATLPFFGSIALAGGSHSGGTVTIRSPKGRGT